MKKSISIKTLVILMAAVLVLGVVAGGTFAYLKKTTSVVTNTFTKGGGIDLSLYEHKWTGSGLNNGVIVYDNSYSIVPGNTYAKDPTVEINTNGMECYLFIKVEASATLASCITYQIADGWTLLSGNVYYRTVTASSTLRYPVLKNNQFSVANTVTETALDALGSNSALKFTAYSIQKADLTPAAAFAQF